MSSGFTPLPVRHMEDYQKGRWGGRPERSGRRLRVAYIGGDSDWFDFTLIVESVDETELVGPVRFHLHDTFLEMVASPDGFQHKRYAYLEKEAWETFTVGAEVRDRNGRWVGLELDLETVKAIPRRYKPLKASLQRAGAKLPGRLKGARLESLIEGNQIITTPAQWRAAWVEAERWVCRIKYRNKVCGTGFLIGPDLVLTNWHVVEPHQTAPGSDWSFEFDYILGPTEQAPNRVTRKGAQEWLIDHRPPTKAELQGRPSTSLPKPDELDFAIVRLSETTDASFETRGWARIPEYPEEPKGGLIIVQHPAGNLMSCAIDTQGIMGVNKNGTRLKYRTSTLPGSSGSPCFDMDWQLIGLHHAGIGEWPDGGAYNQGIPIVRLADYIDAAQHHQPLRD